MKATHTDVIGPPHDHCRQMAETLSKIAAKWTVLVIKVLRNGPVRYNQIRRELDGISQRMLTLTLKDLEQSGLVARRLYPTIPPRVEYELTDLGRSLLKPLQCLYDWAVEHRQAMLDAKERHATKRPTVVTPLPASGSS